MSDNVKVTIGVESDGVNTGLAKVTNALNAFKEEAHKSFQDVGKDMAGMFAGAAVIEGVKSLAEQFTNISKQSQKFGESAETIQRVGQAAQQNGSDFETVSKALDKVNVQAVEAIKGNGKLSEAFQTLGIDAKSFVDLPMEEKLKVLADGYNKAGSDAVALDAAQQVLGKGSKELTDLLKQGSAGLTEQFNNAQVASQNSVDAVAEATEDVEHYFNKFKEYAVLALGAVIHGVQRMGQEIAVAVAYLAALPHGFKAAKEAAQEAQEAAEALNKEKDEEEKKREAGNTQQAGRTAEIEAEKEAQDKVAQDAQDKADELTKLEEENAKKKNEWYERHVSLAEKELDLKRQLATLNASDAKTNDANQLLKNDNARLDLTKELEKVQEEQKKDADKANEKAIKDAEKLAKEKAKAEIEAKKEELKKAEGSLEKLEHNQDHFSVDSLRAIGGGLAGVNYRAINTHEDAQKQQVDLAKQTVEQLKKVVEKLNDKSKQFDNDGSFNLS